MRIFFVCIAALLITSCGNEPAENITGPSPSIAEQTLGDTCDCDELDIDSLGNHSQDGKPFTGTCVSYYNNSETKYLEKNILNGLLHGKVEYFDRNGETMLREFYENGKQKRSGETESGLTCDCSELKIQDMQGISVFKLDDVPFTGRCEKYYENSDQLYMESNYKKGVLDGYTIYYNRDGSTIMMEKYEAGILVSAVH